MATRASKPTKPDILELLQDIHGIGPRGAEEFAARFAADGHTPATKKAVRTILRKHYFDKLSVGTRADLQYNFSANIPRAALDIFVNVLPDIRAQVCGSYRRLRPTSNDIDIVMYEADWSKLVRHINSLGTMVIQTPFAIGSSRIETVLTMQYASRTYQIKMDAFFTTPEEWPFAILYATGNGLYNLRMRNSAKRHGMRLNQRGLYKVSAAGKITRKLIASSEREIFELLGIQFTSPENRSV
jgi:DNA polymerase/3'-5' exonuclease PolX